MPLHLCLINQHSRPLLPRLTLAADKVLSRILGFLRRC
jgi:hypothetical protein